MTVLMIFNVALALQVQHSRRQPGTGIDPSLHSETVHADGFFHVRCVADEMEQSADLHSDNKFDYANKANVSIIRYKDTLDREKQFPMTPKACFNFCRTVPGMLFFGLIYGRECYCTPYFMPTTAGGNGVCDLPCEGDAASTCGGTACRTCTRCISATTPPRSSTNRSTRRRTRPCGRRRSASTPRRPGTAWRA